MISISADEELRRSNKSRVGSIAHEIFEFADETVGHAENVSKEELMLASYHELGKLLAEWAKKLDKIERIPKEPVWLGELLKKREAKGERPAVSYDFTCFGFPTDNLFFGRESGKESISDDLLMLFEPRTMLMEDFGAVLEFCKRNELDFYVDGFNTSMPGRAFRIVVYKPRAGRTRHHVEFRESFILGAELFRELSGSGGQVEKSSFAKALAEKTGLDEISALKLIDALISSGQIPKSGVA